ncbi:U3 snoRNP protein [Coemansia sp. RSA 1878]|nr:U3 snoRNP protein [Coemansia sp. RSA 1878]
MAEVVQYHLEQMVGELEDLERRDLFTKPELKAIVKKRTKFEYALRRRRVKCIDYLRYIEYEINVDALRRQRKQRKQQHSAKTTLSDFSITQRIIAIFERAVVRHPEDVQLWLQFVEFIKSRRRMSTGDADEEDDGHSRLLSQVFARAISAHPYESQLWIKAAAHELEVNMNGSAARALLQRALRLISDDKELWIEYFRLELLLVEKIKARRRVLGIDGEKETGDSDEVQATGSEDTEDAGFIDLPQLDEEGGQDLMVEKLTEKALAQLDQKTAASVGNLTEEQRAAMSQQTNAYLQGAVAQIVFEQAIQAISDDLSFRQELIAIAGQFAGAEQLRQRVLDSIGQDFVTDADARAYLCSVHLSTISTESPELIDGLQLAVENFKQALSELDTPEMWAKYVEFLSQWLDASESMKSLQAYFAAQRKRAVAMISESRDVRLNEELVLSCADVIEADGGDVLSWLADATQRFPESADVWHRRMSALVAGNCDGLASGIVSSSRIDNLFTSQALLQAPASRKLWDLWFNWTELWFSRKDVSADKVQARYMSVFARVTQQRTLQALSADPDSLAQVQALVAHLQTRYIDWAWKLPASHQPLSAFGELAHAQFRPDDDDSDMEDSEQCAEPATGNIEALRQAYRNVSRHAFPTPGFYRRCIELETDAKHLAMLHEMACRVDEAESEPWLAYLRFLAESKQLSQASDVFWRATQTIPDAEQPAFEAAYKNMFQ